MPHQYETQKVLGRSRRRGHRGDCFKVCIAGIMQRPADHTPNFADFSDDPVEIQTYLRYWLRVHGWFVVQYRWADVLAGLKKAGPPCSHQMPLIFVGDSPRGKTARHAVLGRLNYTGWQMIHDPHPSGKGLKGEPEFVYILAREVSCD